MEPLAFSRSSGEGRGEGRLSAAGKTSARPTSPCPGSFTSLIVVELDVPELAVLLLDLAQVDVLHDVARLRVDEHRAARALEDLALHRGQQRVAAALAAGLLERLVDDAHAVVAAHGHEVRAHALVGLLEGLDELLVRGRLVRRRIVVRGDHAERDVAHVVELVVVGHVAGADQLDAGLVHAALGELLHQRRAGARGHEDEQRIGLARRAPSAGRARSRGCAAARAASRSPCRR